MSARVRDCRWTVLVAWLWAAFAHHALARPQVAASAATASIAPPFTNAAISPLPADGSCGKCGIEAPGGIRLVYWEPDSGIVNASNITLSQNYAQTYTQVDDGFTYTSPSVYVIYSSLQATVTCADSALHTISPSFSQKTIAYSSRFLAYGTLSMPDAGCSEHVVVGGFHTIDFSSLYYNPIITTTTSKAGCAPYVNPRLSLPAELTNVEPRWKSCEPLFHGAFDPPSVLRKASSGLVPSPVGAGQVTDPAVAQPMSDSAPAQPLVTSPPPVALSTSGTGSSRLPPQQAGNAASDSNTSSVIGDAVPSANVPAPAANPKNVLALGTNNVPVPGANRNGGPTPAANGAEAPSNQFPGQQGAETPSNTGQTGSMLNAVGNSNQGNVEVPSQNQGSPPAPSPQSSGNFVNSPFMPAGNGKKVSANADPAVNPSAVPITPDRSAASPALVAVPVDTGDGNKAYAVVATQPASSPGGLFPGGSSPAVAVPIASASLGLQTYPPSGPDTQGGPGSVPVGISDDSKNAGTLRGSSSAGGGNIAWAGSNNGPAGTTSVTLDDGTTANIPMADLIEPAHPQGHAAAAVGSPADYQTVHLISGAFVAVPGASGSPSSVAAQGGDYLVPKPTADVPQQTLRLQGGSLTIVPVDTLSQPITLQGGQITTIPADAPPQAMTLQNGEVSSISPIPHATVTLANGRITAVPVAAAAAGSDENVPDMPHQVLTLEGGKVTTAPIDVPAQTLKLQGGKGTTVPPNAPPQTLTLANGQVSTISAVPHTTVTLANGKVTSLPVSTTAFSDQNFDFVAVPDATVSGKVQYTHLPIIDFQKDVFNDSRNETNGTASGNSSSTSVSALGTANLMSDVSTQATVSTPTGIITKPSATATDGKSSSGNRLWSISSWLLGFTALATVYWMDIT